MFSPKISHIITQMLHTDTVHMDREGTQTTARHSCHHATSSGTFIPTLCSLSIHQREQEVMWNPNQADGNSSFSFSIIVNKRNREQQLLMHIIIITPYSFNIFFFQIYFIRLIRIMFFIIENKYNWHFCNSDSEWRQTRWTGTISVHFWWGSQLR